MQPENTLVRGIRNNDKIVSAGSEAARVGPFGIYADDFETFRADPHQLADRIDARCAEEKRVWRVPQHDHVLAVLHFRTIEEPAAEKRNIRSVLELLRRAEDDDRL